MKNLSEREVTVPTFIMLTRLNTEVARSPKSLEQLERTVMGQVR
jgi:hypothetical protein